MNMAFSINPDSSSSIIYLSHCACHPRIIPLHKQVTNHQSPITSDKRQGTKQRSDDSQGKRRYHFCLFLSNLREAKGWLVEVEVEVGFV
jgi:hypothetical protein